MQWRQDDTNGLAWLARRDARGRLLATFPLLLVLLVLQHWLSVLLLACIIGPLYLTNGPRRWRGGITILSTGFLLPWSVDMGGIHVAALYISKSLTQFMLVSLVWRSAPLAVHAAAAQRLGLPNVVCQLFALMWSYVLLISAEWQRMKLALRTRHFQQRFNQHSRQTLSHAMGTLIVRTHLRGERVSQAMRCRGFQGSFHTLREDTFGFVDLFFVASCWLLAISIGCWDWLQ